jgi:hypothetical protein
MRVGVSHRKTWMGPHGLKVGIITAEDLSIPATMTVK